MSHQPFKARNGFDAEKKRGIYFDDPRPLTVGEGDWDVVNRRYYWDHNSYLKLTGRAGNLPNPLTDVIVDGESYLIKYDNAGKELTRLVTWDSSLTGAAKAIMPAGIITLGQMFMSGFPVPPVADEIMSLLNLPNKKPGDYIQQVTGAPLLVPAGHPLAGQTIVDQGFLLWLGDTRLGTQGWTILPNGINTFTHTGAAAIGKTPGNWRIDNRHTWLKDLVADLDQPTDQEKGDLQITDQKDYEQIKVWANGNWLTIFDWQKVLTQIATLSLFEGTVQEVGGTVIGSVHLDKLPDLTTTTPKTLLGKISHYWVWQGTAGYVIKTGDPQGVGRDLAGLVLQPGDWLQVANTGTIAAPILQWQRIGGDLLSRNRWFGLGGLQPWRHGSWEKDSLVVFNKGIWRATQNVLPSNNAPGPAAAAVAQVSTIQVPTTGWTPGTIISFTVKQSGNPDAAISYTIGAAGVDPDAAAIAGHIRDAFNLSVPGLTIATPTIDATNPDTIVFTGVTAGEPFTIELLINANTAERTAAKPRTGGPWQSVELASGIRWVMTDGQLPPSAPVGEIYFVVQSARNGGGGGLFYWDGGGNRWSPLGGSGGIPLDLSGGQEMIGYGVPVGTIVAYPTATTPSGWFQCDGSTFAGGTYPELAAALGGTTLPDLRGQFLRGWSTDDLVDKDGPRAPGTIQDYATAAPKTGFGYENNAGVQETFKLGNTLAGWATGPEMIVYEKAAYAKPLKWSGGDPETRPKNVSVAYIIKAYDSTITLRA